MLITGIEITAERNTFGKSEAKRRAGGEKLCFLSGDAHTTTRPRHCQQSPIWPISAYQVIVALDDGRDLAESRGTTQLEVAFQVGSGHGVWDGLCVSTMALQSN